MTDHPTWPDLAGRFVEGAHILPVRVYFEDTDFSGLVYHVSYLRWCERGRSDFLRLSNIHHHALAAGKDGAEPCAFAIRRLQADFLKPARVDDVLEVRTEMAEATKASLNLVQTICFGDKLLFKLSVQCALVTLDGRLLRIPAEILTRLCR